MNSRQNLFFIGIVFILVLFLICFQSKIENIGLMVDCSWWIVTSPLWATALLVSLYAIFRYKKNK